MKIIIRGEESAEKEAFYVGVKNKKYLLKEIPEGLQIKEISNDKDLVIRPHSGNSIVLIDK